MPGPLQHLIDQYDRATGRRVKTPEPELAVRRNGSQGACRTRGGRYEARVRIGGRNEYLGVFATRAEAAAAVARRKGEG